ncbi:DUF2628 domain-containing protein, partial [Rhizobium brockwellii]
LIAADTIGTAEQVYFSDRAAIAASYDAAAPDWQNKARPNGQHGNATSLGLFGFDGGR